MTNKTLNQITNLRRQTFGVEVEGNHITRQKAASVAADYFGTGRFEYTASRNGYMTWSAWDLEDREWKFQRDASIYGPDDMKCELVTPILKYEDLEFFQGLLRKLRKAGMVSNPNEGCGVHIHIGVKGLDGRDHTPKTIRNLANIMAAHEMQLVRAIRVDERRLGRWCQVVDPEFLKAVNKKKPETMDQLSDVWYETHDATWNRSSHYNDSRYHMLNLHATFTKGTIEFRMFQFANPADGKKNGIHAGEMKAYIQLCLAMSELAKEVKYASPKPQQTDNEKYALRCWMLRLGFIGDEFKTARSVLLKNMEGDSAWRWCA